GGVGGMAVSSDKDRPSLQESPGDRWTGQARPGSRRGTCTQEAIPCTASLGNGLAPILPGLRDESGVTSRPGGRESVENRRLQGSEGLVEPSTGGVVSPCTGTE